MLGPEAREELNREASERAALERKYPVPLTLKDWEDWETGRRELSFPFPHIPPETVERLYPDHLAVETFFVDSSGFGEEDEPALTVRAFLAAGRRATKRYGTLRWAISEVGQFQVYVTAYRKERKGKP